MKLAIGKIEADNTLTPGSMSSEIFTAINNRVGAGPNEDPKYRQLLAIAIAEGVITHLHQRSTAFVFSTLTNEITLGVEELP